MADDDYPDDYDGEGFIVLGEGLQGRKISRDEYLALVQRSALPSADAVGKINAKLKERLIEGHIPVEKPARSQPSADERPMAEIMREAEARRAASGFSKPFDPRKSPKTRGISSPDEKEFIK